MEAKKEKKNENEKKKKYQNYVDIPQNLTTENYGIWTSSNTMTWDLLEM